MQTIFEIQLTETHLKKSTLNGAKLAQLLGPLLGFSFDDIEQGESAAYKASWPDGSETSLKFYKPRSKPEKRFWIAGLAAKAKAGELLQIQPRRKGSRKPAPILIRLKQPD